MRTALLPVLLLLALPAARGCYSEDFDGGEDLAECDNNYFAEFEDVSEDPVAEAESPPPPRASPSASIDEDEATVELEDGQDEFYDGDTQVPAHLKNSWESYYMGILMVTGLLAYIMNYIIGKNKNSRLAQAWFNSHRELLESNFSLVGDGTSKETTSTGKLNQENKHIYNLWCSGHVCCEGMHIQLKFLKRQDLLNVLARMMRPAGDQVQIKVTLNDEDMDTFVFAVGSRKAMAQMQKEMQDLSVFWADKLKSGSKVGLPESLSILSEMGEVTDGVMDSKMVHNITNNADKIESIHFSGPKVMQEEGQPLKLPETKKMLLFTFNVPGMGNTSPKDMESLLPLMNMVIYSIDKVKKLRLNREQPVGEDCIETAALGRPFRLGMLYDCRNDSLIPGTTLWDHEQLQKSTDVCSQNNTECNVTTSDSIDDKASALKVAGSLKASLLGGLVNVSGSAKFFLDRKKSHKQERVTLQYHTTTKYEQLTMSHLAQGNVSYPNVFEDGTATHVVIAVLHGADAYFVFDREVTSDESKRQVEGEVKLTLSKLKNITVDAEASLNMNDNEKAAVEKFNCTFYGDFKLPTNPSSFKDAVKVYTDLPKMLGDNGEHAVPLKVWLYPLVKLDSRAARLQRVISNDLITYSSETIENLNMAEMKCNDLVKEMVPRTFPAVEKKIQDLKQKCHQYKVDFMGKLGSVLPLIRGGGKEEDALAELLKSHKESPFNTSALNQWITNKESESATVKPFLLQLQKIEADVDDKLNAISYDVITVETKKAVGPPTDLRDTEIKSFSVNITWSTPTFQHCDFVNAYIIEYKEAQCDQWLSKRTSKEQYAFTLDHLKQNTSYAIRISTDCGDAGTSEPSVQLLIKTNKQNPCETKQNYTLLKPGNPEIYRLNLKSERRGQFSKQNFGRPSVNQKNKTIMLLGATGTGKTTLINGMINYVLGVQWEDKWRFKLIDEVTDTTQAESQTAEVTAYQIYHTEEFQVPYSLTIIDTPGFGDTRGIKQDKAITDKIREFFSHPDGIVSIDAVCVVVQSALARLTHTQKYIFQSILAIFGKDIAENIIVLITFADGQRPPVLDAIKAAEIPCGKQSDGTSLHFKFNNSALFASNEGPDSEGDNFDQMFWKMGKGSMRRFFNHLDTIQTQSLQLTKEVLRERKQLEVTVEGLQPMIQVGLAKLDEIKTTRTALQQHQSCIEANKDFEYVVDVSTSDKIDLPLGTYITNCQKCNYTCHYPCQIPQDEEKNRCAAITASYCTICPGKCIWNEHYNMRYKWEMKTVKETRTYANLKSQYEAALGQMMNTEKIVEQLETEYERVQMQVLEMVENLANSVRRLKEIALRPDPLATPDYIDLLMQSEEHEAKPGYKKRIAELMEVRHGAEILKKVTEGVNLTGKELTVWQKFKKAGKSKVTGLFNDMSSWFTGNTGRTNNPVQQNLSTDSEITQEF